MGTEWYCRGLLLEEEMKEDTLGFEEAVTTGGLEVLVCASSVLVADMLWG